ncbi:MAG: TlpA disulfide reductase family protein [Bacteroidota bacterium]|nr:TlpA disulfide reductase family protein [Bacteroidota bacterium]
MYKYYCALLILLINLPVEVKCQNKSKIFELDGKINSNTGIVVLLPIGEEIYYPNQKGFYETKVMNKQFTISESCLYPYAFKIGLKINSEWVYISDVFWVDPGNQKLTCNIDSSREVPILSNMTMKELTGTYASSFNAAEFNSTGHDSDSILLNYTKANPNSFVSLWKLIYEFSGNGYESIYDSIYAQFSTTIKNTYTGKVLAKKLNAARIVRIGSIFPDLNLSDSKNQKVLTLTNSHNKFTLIEFWNIHCGPCIKQFDALKNLYSTYNAKGFSIIGISNDKIESINAWKNLIKKHQLPWKQFLDFNGKECANLSIYVLPSNYLLNEEGEIIAKNISTNDLSSFLKMNLK